MLREMLTFQCVVVSTATRSHMLSLLRLLSNYRRNTDETYIRLLHA